MSFSRKLLVAFSGLCLSLALLAVYFPGKVQAAVTAVCPTNCIFSGTTTFLGPIVQSSGGFSTGQVIASTTAGTAQIILQESAVSKWSIFSNAGVFSLYDNTAASNRLSIATNGNLTRTVSVNSTFSDTLTNANAGTSAAGFYIVSNGTSSGSFGQNGASYTTAGVNRQDGTLIVAGGAGGLTFNTSVAQPLYFGYNGTEVLRITSAGITFTGGGAETGLAHYQEGTWTPTLSGAGTAGTPTYTTQVGTYERIGRMVRASFSITISAKTAIAGDLRISMPTTAGADPGTNSPGACVISLYSGLTLTAGYTQVAASVVGNNSYANIVQNGSAQPASGITDAGLGAAAGFVGQCVYHM